MKQITIEGGNLLEGTIRISGAKNSAVALIPASLLSTIISIWLNIGLGSVLVLSLTFPQCLPSKKSTQRGIEVSSPIDFW